MAQISNTTYKDNNLASDFHRISGRYCYTTDIDCLATNTGNEDNMFFEYSYDNHKIKPVAMIDWKHPGKSLSDKYSAVQAQIAIADKLEVPFFFIITYLSDEYDTKMYYVIPINEKARKIWAFWQRETPGDWLTLKSYSKFHHSLRKLEWNKDEPINQINLAAVKLSNINTLGDLPNKKAVYQLPELNFSWM